MIKINFKIAKFEKVNEGFIKTGYDEYQITFKRGTTPQSTAIIVNDLTTSKTLDLLCSHSGYKKIILSAISEYKKNNNVLPIASKKKLLSLGYVRTVYNKKIIYNVLNYLLPINKEENRDTLTKYELI